MTLRNRTSMEVERAQGCAIQNAGGSMLEGEFRWTPSGWELSLQGLTFQEVLQVVNAVKQVLE